MAKRKIETTNDVFMGCILTLNDHSFQIELMPVTIRSFDVVIGTDWLSPHRADIMCYKKVVRLHLPNNETLVIYGDKPRTNLRLISCIKSQKCLHKKNHALFSHVVDKKKEEKGIKYIS